jgi:hypothetical protein|uniref:Cytotoxic T lymphocyte-associated protein 2 beta n=1 Tax=Mus musculus TaxID=10090 RepID=A0A286YE78_MOUSE
MMSAAPSPDPSLDNEWKEWKTTFAKAYSLVGKMGTV